VGAQRKAGPELGAIARGDDEAAEHEEEIDELAGVADDRGVEDRAVRAEVKAQMEEDDEAGADAAETVQRFISAGAIDGRPRVAHHQGSARAVNPARSSKAKAAFNTLCSSSAWPMICRPSGRPWPSTPAGTEMAGRPARLAGTAKTSFRYMASGSDNFSPRPKAALGAVGVRIRSTSWKTASKSRAIRARTFCAWLK